MKEKLNRVDTRTLIAVIPLLLVNGIAVTGQIEFWNSHLPWGIFLVLIFALALESVAIFLAYHAHLAQISNDSALRLRFASYGFGIVIGLLNGSHYLNNGRITAAAVGMFIMSASSPWLWAVHSRRASRDKLRDAGLIEPHGLRLGITRWAWHPSKSFSVMRDATWNGSRIPADAIADWEADRAAAEAIAEASEPRMTIDEAASQADAIRVALETLGTERSAPDIADWLKERGHNVSPAYVRVIKAQVIAARRSGIHAITDRNSPPAMHG